MLESKVLHDPGADGPLPRSRGTIDHKSTDGSGHDALIDDVMECLKYYNNNDVIPMKTWEADRMGVDSLQNSI